MQNKIHSRKQHYKTLQYKKKVFLIRESSYRVRTCYTILVLVLNRTKTTSAGHHSNELILRRNKNMHQRTAKLYQIQTKAGAQRQWQQRKIIQIIIDTQII